MFIGMRQVVDIAMQCDEPGPAASAIAKAARARWIHGAGGYIDDITVVVVFLKRP